MWDQFRRLLLGTVVELLTDVGLEVRTSGLKLVFDERSVFEVPRLDNHMRFAGQVDVPVEGEVGDQQLTRLRDRLERVWPELLAVVDLPVGDRLTATRNTIELERVQDVLRIRFDLEAD
jgi:hypothetical protein